MKYCLVNYTNEEVLLLGSVEPCKTDEDVETYFDMSAREDAYVLHRLLAYLWNHPEHQVAVISIGLAPADFTEVESVQ